MFGISNRSKKKGKDEAEKPFWISYADMMTSLMVLFLVVMSVTFLALTKTVTEEQRKKKVRDDEVSQCLHEIEKVTKEVAKDFPETKFDKQHKIVDFGPQAHFAYNSFAVEPKTATQLRQFAAKLLTVARQPCGKNWLKRVGIEGYTSPEGTYLSNLELSLDRSQKVLCVLLEPEKGKKTFLTQQDRTDIQKYFWAAGFFFQVAKKDGRGGRRVELKLEFREWYEGREEGSPKHTSKLGVGRCKL